mgnify:CR=1 FL=1
MTKIIKSVLEWKNVHSSNKLFRKSLGFVPTMGALHDGHVSLFRKSIEENECTVVSIFVNPTQFNDPDDLQNYPRVIEEDLKILEASGVDYLFYPAYKEIYNDSYRYRVCETMFSKHLCGEFRIGHFEGVLTVVLKLLNIIKPSKAYFGEKDFQQYKLIDDMTKALFIDTEIVSCPIIRDKDGLALSSRNLLLTEEERKLVSNFPRILNSGKSYIEMKLELEVLGIKVDYIEEYAGRILGAINIGKVRLIDNVPLQNTN